MTSLPEAVVFGAGSVGRGFLGQLLAESGYQVLFVDTDETLVNELARRHSYALHLVGPGDWEQLVIHPVDAVHALDRAAVVDRVATASLVATSAGARALAAIATSMAMGFAKRRDLGLDAKLNVIVCENLPHAPEQLRKLVRERLEASSQVAALEGVRFVAAVIARMSPVPTADQRSADPSLIVAESYKVLPVDGEALVPPMPNVVGMEPAVPFEAYVARKLYVHNAGHAMLGYLGHARGHQFGYEALQDPWVRDLLVRALSESKQALKVQYHFEPVALQEHIDYLLLRFANRALADPTNRLCRDPLRKLAADDRLVGAARLAERSGVIPEALAWGIAAACAYDEPNDPEACSLQEALAKKGLASFLTQVSGLQADERLAILVRDRYHLLRELRSNH